MILGSNGAPLSGGQAPVLGPNGLPVFDTPGEALDFQAEVVSQVVKLQLNDMESRGLPWPKLVQVAINGGERMVTLTKDPETRARIEAESARIAAAQAKRDRARAKHAKPVAADAKPLELAADAGNVIDMPTAARG